MSTSSGGPREPCHIRYFNKLIPNETLPQTEGDSPPPRSMTINMKTSIINPSDYDISRNGFLPAHPPISRLETPYYEPWERTIDNLPAKIANQSVRRYVDSMPVLTTDKLRGKDEWRRAYVVLSFLMNAYIWSEGPPSEQAPRPPAHSHLRGLQPVEFSPEQTSNSESESKSKSYTNPDAIHATTTFTATPDEDWFYRISIAIESQAARTIPLLLDALAAAERRDARTVERALSVFAEQVVRIGAILERVYERCGAEVFYHRMRPFYVGTDMETAADGGAGLGRG
ncbi:Indoleamine 2,3-dioxygenase, partial [Aspergillus egyptiacus]